MPQSFRLALSALGTVLWACLGSMAAVGQERDPVALSSIDLGFGGSVKVGHWTPVWLTLEARQDVSGRLVFTATDGDGVPVRFADPSHEKLTLTAGQPQRVLRYVKLGRLNRRTERLREGLTVEFVSEEQVLARRTWWPDELPAALPSSREWILTLGPEIGAREVLRQPLVTAIPQASLLPDQWYGYEAVNTIVLTTSDATSLAGWSPQQAQALRLWVQLGGRLILCVGARGAEVLTGDSPWADLAPGTFARVQPVRALPSLETYTSSSQAIDAIRPDGRQLDIPVTLLQDVHGKVSVFEPAAEGMRPIVIRAPLGLGQVVFVAVDLDQPPFSLWEGRPRLVENLVHGDAMRQDRASARGDTGELVHLGYDDMVGQLRVALDQFSGARLVAFSWVAGLVALYILLIGPVDYLLLKDVLHRMQWTWFTFPALAVLFGGLAITLHQRFQISSVKVNQLDLVDVDIHQSLVRGTTWAQVYSPRTEAFDVSLSSTWPGSAAESGTLLSWQGLPGPGLGGLQGASAALFTDPYTLQRKGRDTELHGVPVQTNGTKALGARWWTPAKFPSRTQLTVDADGLLRGEISNPLPIQLTDCQLLYANWVYRLDRTGGILQPGQTTQVEAEQALNLNWRLTRRRVVDVRDVTTPWDQRGLDVPRILEVMMFHGAAGGEGYTHLHNRYQADVDLSEHLRTGRAILVGRTRTPASEIVLNGRPAGDRYDQRWTYCRVVFPVARASLLD